MTTPPAESDGSFPEPLERFEQELLLASDREAVLEDYRRRFPELAEQLGKLAEAMAMLQAMDLRHAEAVGGAGATPPHPERFGPYRVVRSIGCGGMGEVYEAIEEPLGRRVAIKTMRRRATIPSMLHRFDRERRTLARLHHTNVVPIYATGSEGDQLYFAMPYLTGASLGQVIKTARSHDLTGKDPASSTLHDLVREAHSRARSGPDEPEGSDSAIPEMPTRCTPEPDASHPGAQHRSKAYIRSAVEVIATVAEGLHHIHESGVVHRDLKPANIIVEVSGHAWLLDFGLAASIPRGISGPLANSIPLPATESEDSLTHGPLGTILYMAPERHAAGGRSDVRSDVWSLGVTLYELLTLRRPFPSKRSVLADDAIPPRRLVAGVDRGLDAVILKAMHKDPARRYQTALALADDLHRWLRRKPVSAWPTRPIAQSVWWLWLWSRRNKGWAMAIALVVLGCMSLGVYSEERRRHAVERGLASERQLELLDIQGMQQGDHRQGWSRAIWSRIEGLAWKAEEKWAIQVQALASMSGLDARTEKQLPIYAQSLAFASDGRLWLGHTGEGVKRWHPESDRMDNWPFELGGPLAIRPDGKPRQLGPTYPDPDRPDRVPHDPRPRPCFPLRLLDVERREIVRSLIDPVERVSQPLAWALSPEGSRAAATVLGPRGEQHLLVWDADSGTLLHRIAIPSIPQSPALPGPGLVFSPDARLLATWAGSGGVELWSVAEGASVGHISVANPVRCVAFGPNLWLRETLRPMVDRWMLAIGDANGLITLWNQGTRLAWRILRSPGQDVLCLAFSPDGTLLASAGRTQVSQLWDVATGHRLLEFETGDYTTTLAFSPDGARLASSFWNPFVKRPGTHVFALDPGRGMRSFRGLPGPVAKVTFSRSGKHVAALSWDWWAGVWDRDSGRLLGLFAVPRGQYADNADLAFSPDGRRFVVSAGDTATLWEIASGEARHWPLPWGLAEAIAYVDTNHLFLMRSEVRDGSRSPDSGSPPEIYPRLCVLRDLLGPTPALPIRVIDDMNWSIGEVEASPDGAYFLVDGLSGTRAADLKKQVLACKSDGSFLRELPTRSLPSDGSITFLFDPSGMLAVQPADPFPAMRHILLEMPSSRPLGLVPVVSPIGINHGARMWACAASADGHIRLHDGKGELIIERLPGTKTSLNLPFSPDLEGRYLLWGNQSGTVSLADLVEIQRRLTGFGLGW